MNKRFSMQKKLLLIFGLLISLAAIIEGFLAVQTSRKAVIEKIEIHLKDKAVDTAEIVDGRIKAFFQFLEGLARTPIIRDSSFTYSEKTAYLINESKANPLIKELFIVDTAGIQYHPDGKTASYSNDLWFTETIKGKQHTAEPYLDRTNNTLFITFSLPVYDDNKTLIGVIGADVDASWLSKQIDDIIVGQTGYCYILGLSGNIIGHRNFELVQKQENYQKTAKTDTAFSSVAAFEQTATSSDTSEVGYYTYTGIHKIASYSSIATTHWTIIISAPVNEFMDTVDNLRNRMILIGLGILITAMIITFFVARRIVKPIQTAVSALQNIARGDGDLTVRLPIIGNDEITDLSQYFNQTIEKIAGSIQEVSTNTTAMKHIGTDLAGNMTETASAVHQINANIDSVKQQTLTQSASVTETAATVEEIIRTIKQLNSSIENQAASVAQSSAAVEQMVANIASITQTLDKTNDTIKHLAAATADGKETITSSSAITQKITEESGSLLEASNVIQHIASQTNLLAMNAAIEAAHAGEAGKGFAVVADEIRKLAEESSAQGKTITTTLKTLSGEIETLSESSKTAGEKFNTIFTLSGQVKDMSNRLTEAMREQENGSREVLTAIKTINTVTVEVQAGSSEMLRGGEGVASEMHKLDNLTRVIADSMNEMAAGAVQITNAVQDVNEITQRNKLSIDSLAEEVGKFKIQH